MNQTDKVFFKRSSKKHFFSIDCKARKKNDIRPESNNLLYFNN